MYIDVDAVVAEYEWVRGRADTVVPLLNEVRDRLGEQFRTEVGTVTREQYYEEVDAVFTDGDLAVNVTALIALLRELDVEGDYPGFIVDELLGREIAAAIAGRQPLRLLAEATFHYADIHTHGDGPAGADDLDAALAAGFQTRLPGWEWTSTKSPFGIGSVE